MRLPSNFLLAVGLAELAMATFNAFDMYGYGDVVTALGLSPGCTSALNSTIDCDANGAGRAAQRDLNDYWTIDNVTTLCTPECDEALSSWVSAVEYHCAEEQLTVNDLVVKPKILPLKYRAGYDLICLQDSAENYCFYDSQDWDGGAFLSYYSQLSDTQSDTREDELNITDIYDREVYCSECFLSLWRQQLISPLLFPSGYKNYLINQFIVLEEDCSIEMPFTTFSEALAMATASSTPSVAQNSFGKRAKTSAPYFTPATPAMPIHPGALSPCGQYYHVLPGDTCTSIAERVGISHAELLSYNTEVDYNCLNLWANHAICVAPVTGQTISTDGNCDAGVTCEGSPFGSCCNGGQCVQCTSGNSEQSEVSKSDPSKNENLGYENPNDESFDDDELSEVMLSDDEIEEGLPGNNTVEDGYETPKNETVDESEKAPDDQPSGIENPEEESLKPSIEPPKSDGWTNISKDGKCSKKVSCLGSGFGDCCSTSGYCGSGPKWCGIGHCLHGDCETELGGQSADGTCGPLFPGSKTCVGTEFGPCCSIAGYCGSTEAYCGQYCYSGECFVAAS